MDQPTGSESQNSSTIRFLFGEPAGCVRSSETHCWCCRWLNFKQYCGQILPMNGDSKKNAATSFRVCRVTIDPGFQTLGSGGIRNCVLNPACRIKNGLSEYRVAAETSGFSKEHWLTKPPGTNTMVQQAVRFVTASPQLFLPREQVRKTAEADHRSQMF